MLRKLSHGSLLRSSSTGFFSTRSKWYYKRKRDMKESFPEMVPDNPSVILFPGQGSQYVGMAKAYVDIPEAKSLFDIASDVLGYDLLKLCNEGPIKKLNQTINCQPAVMVTSLAALELLKIERPGAIESCIGTAGFSLGELSALVFAGAMPFDAGVKLVRTRARLMQEASDKYEGGMAAMMVKKKYVKRACHHARDWCLDYGAPNPDIRVANYLHSTCRVVSGCSEGLRYLEANIDTFDLKRMIPIPTYGAFHSKLMAQTVHPFWMALKRIELSQPAVSVFSNVTGAHYKDVREIQRYLPRQIMAPVKWEHIMTVLYEFKQHTDNYPDTFVCGPGKALPNILKYINNQAYERTVKIGE